MSQSVIDTTHDGHSDVEARMAMEVNHLYGLLASLFRAEPTSELLQALRKPEMIALLKEVGIDFGQDLAGCGDDAALIEELSVEYAALFLGPGGHISPHESVHANPEGGMLMGEETVSVKRFIEALDLTLTEDYVGLPDHLSVELDLMANLVGHEAQGWEESDLSRVSNAVAYQQDFMREHLMRWVPQFCKQVIERAELGFYRSVAKLTRDFLVSEAADLKRRLELTTPQAMTLEAS